MPLPAFNEFGDLPEGRHAASLAETVARFGPGTPQRVKVTKRLRRIHELPVPGGDGETFFQQGTATPKKKRRGKG